MVLLRSIHVVAKATKHTHTHRQRQSGVQMGRGETRLGGGHTMRYTDHVLWTCTLETCILLLTNVTPIDLILKAENYFLHNFGIPQISYITQGNIHCEIGPKACRESVEQGFICKRGKKSSEIS